MVEKQKIHFAILISVIYSVMIQDTNVTTEEEELLNHLTSIIALEIPTVPEKEGTNTDMT